MISVVSNQLIKIGDRFSAGFLVSEESGKKEYVIFEVRHDERPTFVRSCTRAEKKQLAKLIYGERSVRSMSTSMESGETCLLFIAR